MPFKIIRNDITKMNTEAIVNTANDHAAVGTGCDSAVYEAAGYQEKAVRSLLPVFICRRSILSMR